MSAPDDQEGLCPVCGRDAESAAACSCCKTCGSKATPCACEFDLSTVTGRRDYERYGDLFVPMSRSLHALPPLKFKPICEKCNREQGESCQHCGKDVGSLCECCERCGPGFSIQMRRYLQYNVRPPGVSIAYMDAIDDHPNPPKVALSRVVFCTCRFPNAAANDPALRCVLREYHDGDHQLVDDRRWANERCAARCAVKNEVYTPIQCDKAAGHDGDHEAYRGDGVSESNRWTWPESLSIPGWIPRAYVQPAKKRTLWTIVREFFARRRHIRPPEGGPKT